MSDLQAMLLAELRQTMLLTAQDEVAALSLTGTELKVCRLMSIQPHEFSELKLQLEREQRALAGLG